MIQNPTNLLERTDDAVDVLMRDLRALVGGRHITGERERQSAPAHKVLRPFFDRFVEISLECLRPVPESLQPLVIANFTSPTRIVRTTDHVALRLRNGTVSVELVNLGMSTFGGGAWEGAVFRAVLDDAQNLDPYAADEMLELAEPAERDDLQQRQWVYYAHTSYGDGRPRDPRSRFVFEVWGAYRDLPGGRG